MGITSASAVRGYRPLNGPRAGRDCVSAAVVLVTLGKYLLLAVAVIWPPCKTEDSMPVDESPGVDLRAGRRRSIHFPCARQRRVAQYLFASRRLRASKRTPDDQYPRRSQAPVTC